MRFALCISILVHRKYEDCSSMKNNELLQQIAAIICIIRCIFAIYVTHIQSVLLLKILIAEREMTLIDTITDIAERKKLARRFVRESDSEAVLCGTINIMFK